MDKDNNNSGQTWAFIHICPLFDDNERTTHLKGITVHIFWRKSITSGSQAQWSRWLMILGPMPL